MLTFWDRGQLFHVTDVISEKFPTSLNQETWEASNVMSWTLLVIEESLSYWLTCLPYSFLAYLTYFDFTLSFNLLKISST